jgi:hypothetical protein
MHGHVAAAIEDDFHLVSAAPIIFHHVATEQPAVAIHFGRAGATHGKANGHFDKTSANAGIFH